MAEAKTLNRDAVEAALTAALTDATPEQGFIVSLLQKGLSLHDERVANTKATAANRTMLRGMLDQGIATPEQIAAIDALYPKPERKAKDTPDAGPNTPPAATPGDPPATPSAAAAKPAATAPPAAKK